MFINPQTVQPLSFPTAVTSGLSVGVPGTLMTWRQALDRWGRFPLAADLKSAEHAARAGYTIDDALSEEIRENAGRFAQFSSTKALFLPGGAVPSAGTRLTNPDLAQTYRQIGREGVGALYGGPIGADEPDRITVVPMRRWSRVGPMALSDLAASRRSSRPRTSTTAATTSPRGALRAAAPPSASREHPE
jgi:gamma-glutamyltranspeptidase/glutathione hydrolase